MFTRGRRLFTIASFATILVSALHTIGNLNTTPADTGEAAVQHLMRGYTIPLGLVLAADRQVGARVLRRVALVLAITSAGLMTLFFLYRIPPPLVSFVVVTLLYAAAVVTTKERPQ